MLRALKPNEKLQRHSTAVAEVAAFLADAMVRRGVALDATAVESRGASPRPRQDAARG